MSKSYKDSATVRLNLAISQTTRDKIEDLMRKGGSSSLAETIRQALTVYEFLLQAKEKDRLIIEVTQEDSAEIKKGRVLVY